MASAGALPLFDLSNEAFGQGEDIRWRLPHQGDGCVALANALKFGKVVRRRSSHGSGEEAGQGMVGGPCLEGGAGQAPARRELVMLPKRDDSAAEGFTSGRVVMGLGEEVRHGESHVEHRVAPVDDFVVEENQAIPVNEDVLGAVIAVNQSLTNPPRLLEKRTNEGRRSGDLPGGKGVERFEPERLEVPRVGENRSEARGREAGPPMDGPEQVSELPDMIGIDDPGKEEAFPIRVGRRDRLHGQEMMFMILEHQGGNGARRREGGQPAHSEGFTMDSLRAAMPRRGHAEPPERLFHHPRFSSGPADQDGSIGDPAGEDFDIGRFAGPYPAGRPQPFHKAFGLFDVQFGHGIQGVKPSLRPRSGGPARKT